MNGIMRSFWYPVLALLGLCLLSGCGHDRKTEAFLTPYLAGQVDLAARRVDQTVGPVQDAHGTDPRRLLKVNREDAILFRLEQGTILRSAGRLEDSTLAFRHALSMIQQLEEQADFRIGQEVAAMFANQSFRDYQPTAYDRLALHLYLALNAMQMGRLEDARTALRGMQQALIRSQEHQEKRLTALQRELARREPATTGAGPDYARTLRDPEVMNQLRARYGADAPLIPDRSAYRAISNPFGEYLLGIYLMAAGADANDAETAVTAFKRVLSMRPGQDHVLEDLLQAEQRADGGPLRPTTYVFFETGMAPSREEFRIDLPIFLINLALRKNTGLNYIGAAFPYLRYQPSYFPYLSVRAGKDTYRTTVMTDMDEVIRMDFENELPTIVFRTIVSSLSKAAAAYALHQAVRDNPYASLLTQVATTVYQYAMNQADLRTWKTLPKQFQATRLATPEDRILILSLPTESGYTDPIPPLTLQKGLVNVVHVRSLRPGIPVIVNQFVLP